jgi:hypothetical protein
MTGAQHVTVAVSRNPENAAPIAGSFKGPPNSALGIAVDVTVVRVDPVPSPAPPVPVMDLSSSSASVTQTQPIQQAQQMAHAVHATAMEMVIRQAPAFQPQGNP